MLNKRFVRPFSRSLGSGALVGLAGHGLLEVVLVKVASKVSTTVAELVDKDGDGNFGSVTVGLPRVGLVVLVDSGSVAERLC